MVSAPASQAGHVGSVSAPLRSALSKRPLDVQRPVMPIYPRRLKDRPDGHEPSDARSIRAGDAVTVADMVMQRIVVPPYAGSNRVSHLT